MSQAIREGHDIRNTLEQFKFIHNNLNNVTDAAELISILHFMNFDKSYYSYKKESYVLIICEIVFINLLNNKTYDASLKEYLEEIRLNGENIYEVIRDHFFLIIYHLFMSIYYFQKNNVQKSLDELLIFENLTSGYNSPEDKRYVLLMKEFIGKSDYQNMRSLFKKRTLELINRHFKTITKGIVETDMIKLHILIGEWRNAINN